MKKGSKIFTIIGFILAVLYCINFFMVFSAIGPNILNLKGNSKIDVYNYTKTTNENINNQNTNQGSSNSISNINQNTSNAPTIKEASPIKKPAGLNVACYTDESKTQWIWLGPTYVSDNPLQTNISKIYCSWTNFDSPSGINGYYVYIGKNLEAIPSKDGYFTKDPNTILTFSEPGRYRFMIQAKDNEENISEVVDFGAYHYLMLEEDKK